MRGRYNQYIISRLHDNGVYDNCFLGGCWSLNATVLGRVLIDFLDEEEDDDDAGFFLEEDDDDVKLS